MTSNNWINLAQDDETRIETLRAHFEGHAYDPHWHDSYLVGVTEQGVQQFNCRRNRHHSTPGNVFLLEPGEIHDGDAPEDGGFTYRMLYLDPQWLQREISAVFQEAPANTCLAFASTLSTDSRLAQATARAFDVMHHPELRIVRQHALNTLLQALTCNLHWRKKYAQDPRLPRVAQLARDYLHDHMHHNVGIDELTAITGVDRYRLNRAFKSAYGLAPHAYLVQLRLAKARRLLALGVSCADVAIALGFADQSHLGRWFVRANGMTPAAYQKRCTNVPDR